MKPIEDNYKMIEKNILDEIVRKKALALKKLGPAMGVQIPPKRNVPLRPFTDRPCIICEIKRSSPSKGTINANLNPVEQAKKYVTQGINKISVLTEKNYFSGSLTDLMLVKRAFPEISVLRKDFILSEEEVEVSYRAGADAVLLIASILKVEEISKIFRAAKKFDMNVLVEIHSESDFEKIKHIKPNLIGINSRNLETFKIDRFQPLTLKSKIKPFLEQWKSRIIFESGITDKADAVFAFSSGFDGILVGESVVRNPDLVKDLVRVEASNIPKFWDRLMQINERPLVKICGITNENDAIYVSRKGAHILGFVFARSPRRANYSLLNMLKNLDVLKVAVVTPESFKNMELRAEIEMIVEHSLVDAIQLHGFQPENMVEYDFEIPHYNAVRIKSVREVDIIPLFNSPRILIDHYDKSKEGGTGKIIPEEIITEVKSHYPLWLAGGLGPHNVRSMIKNYNPELIDASSKLEAKPGKKDHQKIDTYFKEIKNAKAVQ